MHSTTGAIDTITPQYRNQTKQNHLKLSILFSPRNKPRYFSPGEFSPSVETNSQATVEKHACVLPCAQISITPPQVLQSDLSEGSKEADLSLVF